VSDSGSNLGIRVAGGLFIVAGLFLISIGRRIRHGRSRLPVPPTMTTYGFGVFVLGGAVLVVAGAIVLGIGI
jgi:hypothetical protein